MRKFEYSAFLKVIERFKVTNLQVAPPIIVMLGREAGEEELRPQQPQVRHVRRHTAGQRFAEQG